MKRAVRGGVADLRRSMLETPQDLQTRKDYAAAIEQAWQRSLNGFVQIGRYLREAKDRLKHGEYEAMIEQDLPFSPSVGRRLRQAADLVDSGQVPQEALPNAYSIVADIATLSDDERAAALDQGIIRPDMTRQDLQEFKRAARAPEAPAEPAERRDALQRGLDALLDEGGAGHDVPPTPPAEEHPAAETFREVADALRSPRADGSVPPVATWEDPEPPAREPVPPPALILPPPSAVPPVGAAPATATVESTRKALSDRLAQLELQRAAIDRQIAEIKGQLEDLDVHAAAKCLVRVPGRQLPQELLARLAAVLPHQDGFGQLMFVLGLETGERLWLHKESTDTPVVYTVSSYDDGFVSASLERSDKHVVGRFIERWLAPRETGGAS